MGSKSENPCGTRLLGLFSQLVNLGKPFLCVYRGEKNVINFFGRPDVFQKKLVIYIYIFIDYID